MHVVNYPNEEWTECHRSGESDYLKSACRDSRPSYSDFKHCKEYEKCSPCDIIKRLLSCEAQQCQCDTKLYCETTSRLSYELCMAKNLCEVKQVIESINSLFRASALSKTALADMIKAYGIACNKKVSGDCCDRICKEMMKD